MYTYIYIENFQKEGVVRIMCKLWINKMVTKMIQLTLAILLYFVILFHTGCILNISFSGPFAHRTNYS